MSAAGSAGVSDIDAGFCRIWKGRTSDQFLKSIYDGYRESSMIYIFSRVYIDCGRIRRESLLKGLGSSFPSSPIMFWLFPATEQYKPHILVVKCRTPNAYSPPRARELTEREN
ncbi:uncharacterized protein LOC119170880 isoform X2 [Rhipicephalus microplus]|uniref:uncharacterized protein LOC119170880 isoform X2 n=1 Tax=Rhipicephalus microplus TaxID=6941 RepID=UPI003F6AD217